MSKMLGLSDRTRRQIVNDARLWWDAKGRKIIPMSLNNVAESDPRVLAGKKHSTKAALSFPTVVIKPSVSADLPSGILRGLPFDECDTECQCKIVSAFFRHHWLPAHALEAQHLLKDPPAPSTGTKH
jgi:hypothetical protein